MVYFYKNDKRCLAGGRKIFPPPQPIRTNCKGKGNEETIS
ncbi:hypothetical protein SUBVAR_06835 [Subdoligranulum variabile DSM 15176]|uniref:Uncharacterized protein n=1 Tax=Subdoligranulum variabile DSM 15176 TaxID=411471 RepID=D1PR08_9FIRM|nr:hypothetical protein SUBVAR_06835 [Subdoligranulum variabile DSM 15176]